MDSKHHKNWTEECIYLKKFKYVFIVPIRNGLKKFILFCSVDLVLNPYLKFIHKKYLKVSQLPVIDT